MDKIFGNDRFWDVPCPELPEQPPAGCSGSHDPGAIALPYLAPRPNRGQVHHLYLTPHQLAQHIEIVGAIGTGKTNLFYQFIKAISDSMLVRQYRKDDVIVIFDPKGDFRRRFFRPEVDLVISPNGNKEWRWDLMSELRPVAGAAAGVDRRVLNALGHILFDRLAERSSQPFFAKAARRVFCGVLEHLAREAGVSNARVIRFWNSASQDEIRQLLSSDPYTRGLVNYIPANVEGQAIGVLAEIHGVVNDLFQGGFAEPGGISIRAAIRERRGRRIFLDFPVSDAETMTDSFRVLVALAIREALLMGEENEFRSHGLVWFVIDEFRRLPHILQFEPGMNFGRGAGLRFILGMQTQEQLKKDYEAEASSILAGANSMFSFWVSDPETRRAIRDRGGKKLLRTAVENVGLGDPIQDLQEQDIVRDEHILALEPGQAIVCLPRQAPFKLKFPLYDDVIQK
jgi:hypothetical protein